ncbi:MAG: transferrin receptor-like dimerization domain-containing protein [Candidatus Hydrogenedentota bacterium]
MVKRFGAVILGLSVAWGATNAWAEDYELDVKGAGSESHSQLEEEYSSKLNADNLREWMQQMTTRPHHLGAAKTEENALFLAEQFRSWGYETAIETYYVLFPTPVTRSLTLNKPIRYSASLSEEVHDESEVGKAIREEGLPPFNAYSADGKVTGDLVYVHEGLPKDYEELERRGIDVAGKIVIAQYGGSWRGIKPKLAAEKGAIGCIIYNEPQDDGYGPGEAYPKGKYKHDSAVQRGSIYDLPRRPGDPLTPYYGSTKDAERISMEDAETLVPIPVLPISSGDAKHFLEALEGPVAPKHWRGALPITYRMGGTGEAEVTLEAKFKWDNVPAHNVIAKMTGSDYPDELVIRGNHHDAWVIGASDPISGLVALMEQARVMGELAKNGWRPKRTIVFCAWDGEEPGLLGSTEWVEDHRGELHGKAVAYINTDGNSRGFLRISGSHAYEPMAASVADAVNDPQTDVSVAARRNSYVLVNGTEKDKEKAKKSGLLPMGALGSGSDYSAFIQHMGIASFNVGFGGEGSAGEYHTSFDTFDHYSRFKDPKFEYGVALADVCGRLTLRLADATLLPVSFSSVAKTISGYVDEVVKLADTQREEVDAFNSLIDEGHFDRAADPTKTFEVPDNRESVPHFNFALLLTARDQLNKAAETYERLRSDLDAGKTSLSKRSRAGLNQLLFQSERAFLNPDGLPRRPWFRHQIYAPGYYTGYGVKTLPGIREGIEERKYEEAQEQIEETAFAIMRFTSIVEQANGMLPSLERMKLAR